MAWSERLVVLFDDGSMSVHPEGWTIDRAIADCREEDPNEPDLAKRPKLVKAKIEIGETVWTPSTVDAAAAVDGDAQWNAALNFAATELEKESDYIAASIVRSLKKGPTT